ncbi:DUF397 domain-containing protein [Saccharopolyspora gregorii]|uniref:DUF397 domain-containing protein n=1 Tax=Saccharopolyspora gregorii TaxID=33914 RepID=A0ABP6RIW0_9PSEU|nr:DUF397 domain-containing protein [Saccharopolyspora gregorii]
MNAPDFSQATWRKSTRSNGGGAACVEIASIPGLTGVRDSKLGETSPVLPFSESTWSTFLNSLKTGTYDR